MKNGPLLGEERLGGREVDLRRVGLDLAEVGIDRRVEREVRAKARLQIGAGARAEVAALVERVSRIGVVVDASTHPATYGLTSTGRLESIPLRPASVPNRDDHARTVRGIGTQ